MADSTSSAAPENKVWASTAGAGIGTAALGLILWTLGVVVFGSPADAEHAVQAVAAVPGPIVTALTACLPVVGAFVGGYLAKHTHRPDLANESNALTDTAELTPPAT